MVLHNNPSSVDKGTNQYNPVLVNQPSISYQGAPSVDYALCMSVKICPVRVSAGRNSTQK
jgi:hypothetical protein